MDHCRNYSFSAHGIGGTTQNFKVNQAPGNGGYFIGGIHMSKYIYVLKHNADAVIRVLNQRQQNSGTFYNISVLPYRGKALDPDQYVTIKIG